jgi:NAD(P)-dependent dehydrogenase (short-subunit alcohol dehydrogenase family)
LRVLLHHRAGEEREAGGNRGDGERPGVAGADVAARSRLGHLILVSDEASWITGAEICIDGGSMAGPRPAR